MVKEQEKRETCVYYSYKSVLILNNASDSNVTLFVYPSWDRVCWLSCSSKTVLPRNKYLHRSKGCFKYKLQASGKERKKVNVLETRKWESDKAFSVTDSLEVIESDLKEHEQEKRVCIRRLNKEEEITSEGGCNLYDLLKLDMKDVRKIESKEKQNQIIKEAFHREIRRWHPDRNPDGGDDHMAHEVIVAYEVLIDPERRAQYHNAIDYDKGWLSTSRWKSIFKPECATKEQKRAYLTRIGFLALSVGLAVGGVVLTACTAGMALPAVVAGSIAGGALIGGGVQGGLRTVKHTSIEKGCDIKKLLESVALGALGGAAVGGAAAGIMTGIAAIGSAASEDVEVMIANYVAIGSATGSSGGVISSVTGDLDRMLVSGEEIPLKQVVAHAACGSVVGGIVGVAGEVVTKAVAGQVVAVSAANFEGEALEQAAIKSGAKQLGNAISKSLRRPITENSTGAVMDATAHMMEECHDDSNKNQSPGKHFIDTTETAAVQFAEGGKQCASAIGSQMFDDIGGGIGPSKKGRIFTINDSEGVNEQGFEQKKATVRKGKSILPFEDWKKSSNYQITEVEKLNNMELESESTSRTIPLNLSEDKVNTGRVRYISKGLWKYKMVVKYQVNGSYATKKVSGSDSSVEIPENACDIEVSFKVLRGPCVWCDVKKFDRFKGNWCEPTVAHVFRYEVPPFRTFTISGSLYYEAVMKITNENYDELDD